MPTLPVLTWIGNAAAVLFGKRGAVADQTDQAGCSRQAAYQHAAKVHQAVTAAQQPGPTRADLLVEVQRLRAENHQLWDWLEEALDVPKAKQRQFAVTAAAMGLSLCQTIALLAVLLPRRCCPPRATLGRWVHQTARQATGLLAVLDRACRNLVVCVCLDEIFFRRQPVLMGVEPHSLAWVLGTRAADRSGPTWANALAAWPAVEDVAADGGSGIAAGLELAAARRAETARQRPAAGPAKPFHVRLDVFHIRRDGARALRVEWGHAQAVWEAAEQLERAKGRFDRGGTDRRKFKRTGVEKAWAKAAVALGAASAKERAWHRVVAALALFRPDGRVNDRRWAQAELRAASAVLTGRHWAKVCRQLQDERALTFLDRLQADLAAAEPRAQRRAALVALWRWRRAGRGRDHGAAKTARAVVAETVAAVVRARLGRGGKESYARVRRVLERVVRASSAVECVNSVVRMHQARHRNLSQELLDLKRLYWNCRSFVEGKRRGRCPYEHLGLQLPTYDPWELLQRDPKELEQQLSTAGLTE
jgi:hypothetical protein